MARNEFKQARCGSLLFLSSLAWLHTCSFLTSRLRSRVALMCDVACKILCSYFTRPGPWSCTSPPNHGSQCGILCLSRSLTHGASGLKTAVLGIAMECPWCHQVRYSRDWKHSQWASWSAMTEEYNACKVCSATNVRADAAEVVDVWKRLCAAYNYVARDASLRSSLSMIVETWMNQASGRVRKGLSYHGRITSRILPGQFFDPGNRTYYLGMKLLFPELLNQYAWNQITFGDIFEAFLGLGSSNVSNIPSVRGFARWLDFFFYHLYRFCVLVQDRSWTIQTIADCEDIVSDFRS